MDATSKLALLLVVPISVAAAWMTARATAPAPPDADRDGTERLAARVERIERALELQRAPAVRDDRALLRRVEDLEARLGAPAAAPSAPGAPGAAAPSPDGAAAAANEKVRQGVVVALTTEPGAGDHAGAVRTLAEHLVKSVGPPLAERDFGWAVSLLDREARRDRVTPQEAEELASILSALPAGHAARPAIAKAVAVGWSRDPRMGGFLTSLASNAEPALHQGVLSVLDDEHPSAAFSEYVIRLVREERDAAVLAGALDLDRMEAAATATAAPRLVQAIEARVADGTLDAKMRARAGLAIAVACLRLPDVGVATLRRLADREADAKLAERYRAAASALQEGDATLKLVERLFE